MALDFPASPSNGQKYFDYVYDSSLPGWRNVNTTDANTLVQVGLVPVVPTSVAVGSGSSSVGTNGVVTFAGASSVSLNGVFTSSFRNYRIIISETYSSTGTIGANFKFRYSGADSSVSNFYGWGGRSGNAGFSLRGGNATSYLDTQMIINPLNSGTFAVMTMDVFNPAETQYKSAVWTANGYDGTTNATSSMSMFFNANGGYDGFSLIASANALTGKISVYGYR